MWLKTNRHTLTSVSTHCFTSIGAPVMSSTLYWMLVMDLSVLLMTPTIVTYDRQHEPLPNKVKSNSYINGCGTCCIVLASFVLECYLKDAGCGSQVPPFLWNATQALLATSAYGNVSLQQVPLWHHFARALWSKVIQGTGLGKCASSSVHLKIS